MDGIRRIILGILSEEGRWMFASEVVEAGKGTLELHTIFRHLRRLDQEGLVESRKDLAHGGHSPERFLRMQYRITALGRKTFVDAELSSCTFMRTTPAHG